MEKFTGLQMKSLLLWTSLPEESRTITSLAMRTKVSRTAVRKALNEVVKHGILDPDYRLTETGAEQVKIYQHHYQMLLSWMKLHHVDQSEWDGIYTLMTEMGTGFQHAMMEESLLCGICRENAGDDSRCFQGIDLAKYLAEGTYEVQVEFRKLENEELLSMANRAFKKPAYLIVGKEESEIVLKRLRIFQFSPEKRREVSGMMRSMEYRVGGRAKTIRAREEDVRIPTKDILWKCSEKQRNLSGQLEIGFTCTAGFHGKDHNRAVMCVDVLGAQQ